MKFVIFNSIFVVFLRIFTTVQSNDEMDTMDPKLFIVCFFILKFYCKFRTRCIYQTSASKVFLAFFYLGSCQSSPVSAIFTKSWKINWHCWICCKWIKIQAIPSQRNMPNYFLISRYEFEYISAESIFPQMTYQNLWDTNQDCMTREITTFPLSYRAQWNRRVTLWVIQPKVLLPFWLFVFRLYWVFFSTIHIYIYLSRTFI